ncbi:MAG TPA: glycosyltransferase family 1 protein [Xanthomonadaceae bacterium]|nr:glycosyltransferase family 4 protein [Xanthomonadales bacterium]HPF74603.1 glycosyltransferase family 1 protein [Xanthomonadaceae bacterium]
MDAAGMTLRVAFGTSVLAAGLLGDGVDGIGTVTRELLTRLQPRAGLDLRPFEFAEIESGCIDGSTAVGDYRLQARRALLLGRSFSRLKHMVRNKVDLVHATDHQIPRVRGTPLLATLMDAIPLSHPEWVTYRHKRLVNAMWRRSAHWADHIVTISAFSRDEISRHFRIPESRISVMPLGVDERWFHSADAGDERQVRLQLELPERFFLFVGTIQPRKNLEMLIQAHAMLPESVQREVPLLIAGRGGWGCEALVTRLRADAIPNVRWLRYVPDQYLPSLFGMATALLFPSLFEGFGLPVLEGFAAGVPVLASNRTSIPEVAGEAAELLDPQSPAAWAGAMQRLATSPSQQQSMREKGLARAREFSWDRAADRLVDIYQHVTGLA